MGGNGEVPLVSSHWCPFMVCTLMRHVSCGQESEVSANVLSLYGASSVLGLPLLRATCQANQSRGAPAAANMPSALSRVMRRVVRSSL